MIIIFMCIGKDNNLEQHYEKKAGGKHDASRLAF